MFQLFQAAQEKEELQQKGDKLDMETRQAEQELVALENTLAVMNGCNQVFHVSYSKLPENSEELKLGKELQEEQRVLSIKSRYDMVRINELRQLVQVCRCRSLSTENYYFCLSKPLSMVCIQNVYSQNICNRLFENVTLINKSSRLGTETKCMQVGIPIYTSSPTKRIQNEQ